MCDSQDIFFILTLELGTCSLSPGCYIWESLGDLLEKKNYKPLIFHIVPKLSDASNVSRNTSWQ